MDEDFINYKKDYSAYILRVEMKRLGRLIKNNELNQQEVTQLRYQIEQIKDTLTLIKSKYNIVNIMPELEEVPLETILTLSQKTEKSADAILNEMIKQMKNNH